ncbi:MAG: hypothetical protein AAB505_00110 [Patescibacteria group bacterium]
MNKELIQDIKQPKRRLSDVLPKAPETKISDDPLDPNVKPRRRRSRVVGGVVIVLILIALPVAYFASQALATAVIKVTPKQLVLSVDDSLKMPFETMTIRATTEKTIVGAEKKSVSDRASGQIIVTNRYSSQAQRLVANTRFQTAAGKIYRIKDDLSVPGYVSTGGKITPGEINAMVFADQPGPDYNGELAELTIPGFKNDPRAGKITARGKTAMTGGFIGERLEVSAEVRAETEKTLTDQLTTKLIDEARAGLPAGLVTYPETGFFRFKSHTDDNQTSNELVFTVEGELTTLIFPERELSQRLAENHVTDFKESEEALVVNFAELEFIITDRANFDPAAASEVSFKLNGQAKLVWQFDPLELKRSLGGIKSVDYQKVLIDYPSIASAEINFRPPWINRFPRALDRIEVEIVKAVDR